MQVRQRSYAQVSQAEAHPVFEGIAGLPQSIFHSFRIF